MREKYRESYSDGCDTRGVSRKKKPTYIQIQNYLFFIGLNRQITIFTGDRADEILHGIQESSVGGVKIERKKDIEKNTRKGILKKNQKNLDAICVQEVEKHRKNLLEVLVNSNATPIKHRSDQGYKCFFCSDQYPLVADLKLHTLQSHDEDAMKTVIRDLRIYTVKLDITSLQCSICQREIPTIEQLMEHLIEHHKRTLYRDIKNHMIPFKFTGEDLKCAICSRSCTTFRNLTEHMNVHYRNYICDSCGVGFVNRDILRSHKRIHKTGTFSCSLCSKTFDTRIKKTTHETVVHKKSCMNRKCGYCDEVFGDHHKKMNHLHSAHGVKLIQFKCEVCGQTFKKHTILRNHMRKIHMMEREVKCDVCGHRFFAKKDLKRHMVKHTNQRDYRCDLCGKAFARSFTLKQHMRVHTKERRVVRKASSPHYLLILQSDTEPENQ